MPTKQWNPRDLLEISGFYWKTAVLHAAVKLDVFTVIGDGQLAANEISPLLEAKLAHQCFVPVSPDGQIDAVEQTPLLPRFLFLKHLSFLSSHPQGTAECATGSCESAFPKSGTDRNPDIRFNSLP